jgi:chloramphenicol 3-O-phosphotransferase
MCLLGRSFLDAGFTVVLDDIIMGESWPYMQAQLNGIAYSLVVLAPHVEVVAKLRDRNRAKRPLGEAWALYLDQVLQTTMKGAGYWLDTSEQTPEETVDQILLRLSSEHRLG